MKNGNETQTSSNASTGGSRKSEGSRSSSGASSSAGGSASSSSTGGASRSQGENGSNGQSSGEGMNVIAMPLKKVWTRAQEMTGDVRSRVGERASTVRDQVEGQVKERPLAAIGIAALAGVLIGGGIASLSGGRMLFRIAEYAMDTYHLATKRG